MKKTLYILCMVCSLALVSCGGEKKTNNEETNTAVKDSSNSQTVVATPEGSEDNQSTPVKTADYTGKYATAGEESELTITGGSGSKVSFYIVTGGARCTGELKGKVTIDENGQGVYSDSMCVSLTFKCSDDEIKVTEKECQYHGATCVFGGTYKKTSKAEASNSEASDFKKFWADFCTNQSAIIANIDFPVPEADAVEMANQKVSKVDFTAIKIACETIAASQQNEHGTPPKVYALKDQHISKFLKDIFLEKYGDLKDIQVVEIAPQPSGFLFYFKPVEGTYKFIGYQVLELGG